MARKSTTIVPVGEEQYFLESRLRFVKNLNTYKNGISPIIITDFYLDFFSIIAVSLTTDNHWNMATIIKM